jgi:hypothetical protein
MAFSDWFGAFLEGPGPASTLFDAMSRDASQLTHQIIVLLQPYRTMRPNRTRKRKGSERDHANI